MTGAMPRCDRCGKVNPPGSNFCAQCGVPLVRRPLATTMPPARTRQPTDRQQQYKVIVIYSITIFFALSCLILSLVVIIWRP